MLKKLYDYLEVSSITGHFNFCDPSQESISTFIAVRSSDGLVKMHCNITTECELTNDNLLIVVSNINDYLDRWFTTGRANIITIRDYIVKNDYELFIGNCQQELKRAIIKRDKMNDDISRLEKLLSNRGFFKDGIWYDA